MMTTKLKLMVSALVVIALSCQSIVAQPSPVMSSKYTDVQIEQMLLQHQIERSRDTFPTEVLTNKFATDFPNARKVEWEKSANLYEVEFEINRADYDAYYDGEGNLVMYKYEIYPEDLPAVVKNAAVAKYPNYAFDDVDKVVKGSTTIYKVKLEKGKVEVKMELKNDGTIISEYFD